MKRRDKLIFGTIIGGAIGSVLGSLYAPDSGKQTRKKISLFAKKTFNQGKDATTQVVKQTLPHVTHNSSKLLQKLIDRSKRPPKN